MSYNLVDPTTGDLTRVAGGTLYADTPLLSVISSYDTVAAPGWKLLTTDVAGRTLSRTEYKELFELVTARGLIGEGKLFGEGDGSTTFILPDLREITLVGAGENSTLTIASHDVYAVGEFKDDQMQGHWHNSPDLTDYYVDWNSRRFGPGQFNTADGHPVKDPISDGKNGTPRVGTTTHGKQIGVNYFMKVQHVAIPSDFMNAVVKTNSYSTDETVVGRWIDGKPIYRKTINFGPLPNNNVKKVPHGILNIDSFVSINGITFTKDKVVTALPYAHSDSANEVSLFIEGPDVAIRTFGDKTNYTETYVIIECTKTTD